MLMLNTHLDIIACIQSDLASSLFKGAGVQVHSLLGVDSLGETKVQRHMLGEVAFNRFVLPVSSVLEMRCIQPGLLLLICLSGKVSLSLKRTTHECKAGQGVLLSCRDRARLEVTSTAEIALVTLGSSLFRELRHVVGDASIAGDTVQTNQPREMLNESGLGLLFDEVFSRGAQLSPRTVLHYTRFMAFNVAEIFRADAVADTLLSESINPHIKKAHRYIVAHLTEEISVEDIVQAAGVSRRNLFYLFSRELGVTPVEYLRKLRVQAIHQELSDPCTDCSITDVALKYGFSNPGRLSRYYRDYIGELPSRTLRESQGRD